MDPQDDSKPDQKSAQEKADAKAAADLIRQKIDNLYAEEPSAKVEAKEVAAITNHRSKHQQFMHELSTSGKSLAEIQTAWHSYYVGLSEKEKHEVWQEFYAANKANALFKQPVQQASTPAVAQQPIAPKQHVAHHKPAKRSHYTKTDLRTVGEIKKQIMSKANNAPKLKARQHFQSLIFGLGIGSLVMLLLLFSFFNERFIAPFITPSRHVSSTPIITSPDTISAGSNPEVIIPKINVEIPVVYDEPSIAEASVQKALERGVVHYATTPSPGEQGNVVIFGHSSNNIFNPGKYKFAFVLLSRLDAGDTFYLTKNGKLYAYRVYKKAIIQPSEVGILSAADKPDTATLITCDPPGTSLHRLIVIGEQISPNPTANVASTAVKSSTRPAIIPSNAPSLWQRIKDWF